MIRLRDNRHNSLNTLIINIGIVSSQRWVNGIYYYLMRRINPQLRIMRSSTAWRIGRNLYVLRSLLNLLKEKRFRSVWLSAVLFGREYVLSKGWLDGVVARWPVDLTWGSFSSLWPCADFCLEAFELGADGCWLDFSLLAASVALEFFEWSLQFYFAWSCLEQDVQYLKSFS